MKITPKKDGPELSEEEQFRQDAMRGTAELKQPDTVEVKILKAYRSFGPNAKVRLSSPEAAIAIRNGLAAPIVTKKAK